MCGKYLFTNLDYKMLGHPLLSLANAQHCLLCVYTYVGLHNTENIQCSSARGNMVILQWNTYYNKRSIYHLMCVPFRVNTITNYWFINAIHLIVMPVICGMCVVCVCVRACMYVITMFSINIACPNIA